MDKSFWHKRWDDNDIAFHQSDFNGLLVKHFAALTMPRGSRVFVPLCGKTNDIAWFLAQGFQVVAVELSEKAVVQLFESLDISPQVDVVDTQNKCLKRYQGEGIVVYAGDLFLLDRNLLGQVDATYDRAALVALPSRMREKYAQHVLGITRKSPQLLITFAYDQNKMEGPPFSISTEELAKHYNSTHVITLKESVPVPGGLKGACEANEQVWLLKSR